MIENQTIQHRQAVWETFYSNALIGTDKNTTSWTALSAQLSLQTGLDFEAIRSQSDPASQALLRQISAWEKLIQVHLEPEKTHINSSAIAPPQETLNSTEQLCAETQICIEQALQDSDTILFLIVLEQLQKAQLRLKNELLPLALNAGKQVAFRILILQVLGETGMWLAQFNPQWAWASSNTSNLATIDERWENGNFEQRLNAISKERRTDAAKARNRLFAEFSKMPLQERASLLPTFKTNISGEDEEFLENCLKDRSKEIRQIAGQLLMLIPNSQYITRGEKRLALFIPALATHLPNSQLDWEIVMPKEWTKEQLQQAKSDGLDIVRPTYEKMGESGWLLQETLKFLPLTWWLKKAANSAQQLIDWALATDWSKIILNSWLEQTRNTQQPDFLKAFLQLPAKKTRGLYFGNLLSFCDTKSKEDFYIIKIKENPKEAMQNIIQDFELNEKFSPEFSVQVAELIRKDLCHQSGFQALSPLERHHNQFVGRQYCYLESFYQLVFAMSNEGLEIVQQFLTLFETQLSNKAATPNQLKLQEELLSYQKSFHQIYLISKI
jgi:hypothetical protein